MNRAIAKKNSLLLREMGLDPQGYFLVTVHRAENVDVKARLQGIITGLSTLSKAFDIPVLFPMHPGTQKDDESVRHRFARHYVYPAGRVP